MPLALSPAKKNQPREDRDQYYETTGDYQRMLEVFHFGTDRLEALAVSRTDQRPAGGYGVEAAAQALYFAVAQNIVQTIAADYHAIALE